MGFRKKFTTFFSLFAGLTVFAFSEQSLKVDFYGVISPDADKNMIKMTEDLYFTQLKEFDFTLTDLREQTKNGTTTSEETIDFSASQETSNAFFVIIKRQGDALSGWECKICLKDIQSGKTFSESRVYASYYKILMESKIALSKTFDSLVAQKRTASSSKIANASNKVKSVENNSPSSQKSLERHSMATKENLIDEISGVWNGEPFVTKIVIMRGGRGFIIFKDGASMNISVKVTPKAGSSEKIITIQQVGHSNASFFPELERTDAIEAAKIATPIKWTFSSYNENTLSGIKHTLSKDATNSIKELEIPVTWTKT